MKKAYLRLVLSVIVASAALVFSTTMPSAQSAVDRCAKGSGDVAVCSEAIRQNPENAVLYNNRGTAWRNKGDYDRAIADYSEAIRLDPKLAAAYSNRGLAWQGKGDYRKANADFNINMSLALGEVTTRPVLPQQQAGVQAYQVVQPRQQGWPQPQQQAPVAAETIGKRVALVLGNTNYKHAGLLINPTRDAQLVASTLRNVGFQSVTLKMDLTREGMIQSLREFAVVSDNADWAVVYYSGHGIEFGGANYMIPVDAQLQADRDIDLETVNIGQVLNTIEGAKRLRLVILDACRNNPFASQMRRTMASRSIGRGLGRIEPEAGTLVVYAAKHGETAFDGDRDHSPFAQALAKRMEQTPPLEIRRLFDYVRDDVLASTDRKQQPFSYGSLSASEDFYFVRWTGLEQR